MSDLTRRNLGCQPDNRVYVFFQGATGMPLELNRGEAFIGRKPIRSAELPQLDALT